MQATAHAVAAFLQVMLANSYLRKSADAQSALQITMEHTMTAWHVQKTQNHSLHPKKQACASVSQVIIKLEHSPILMFQFALPVLPACTG
jgi:hypothetical protein